MRVLFTVSSWPTHYASMVPLGWALMAAGHKVRVLCAPSQVTPVGRAGLLPVPVLDGIDVRTRLRLQYWEEAAAGLWPYPWLPLHPLTGERLHRLDDFDVAAFGAERSPLYAARDAHSFDAAVEYARAWRPDLILHDPASPEGLLVSRLEDIPSALCLWGPVSTHEPEHMRVMPADHSGSFTRYGLGTLSMDMITRVVDPCPPSLKVPVPAERLPVRFVPYNGTAPVPTWTLADPDRPRVCVSWSTALTTTSGPDSYLLPVLVEALARDDYELVVTATSADVAAIGPVPPSVRVVENVPLSTFVSGCAAVVHHGGSGTTLTAMWAGVPQLAVTFAAEQAVTGRRIAAAGAGLHLSGHEAQPEALRTAVKDLVLSGGYRMAARRLREEIAARPTPAELVGRLESLVG